MSTIDITDPLTYTTGIPHEVFRRMRDTDPVASLLYDGRPFWSVTRYEDLVTVTRDPETYSSARGMTNLWDLTPRQMDARRSLIDTDPPEHVRLRKLGMPAFTGRRVRDYEDTTRLITQELLDEALLVGDVDVVPAISAPLPIRVIVGILGVPAEDADFMVELSDHLVSGGAELAPDAYGNTTPLDLLPFNSPAAFALFDYGRRIGDERRRDPRDDLVTALIQSSIDGDRLSETEYANLFQLLVFAGNETTRTAISNGIKAFMDFPDELEKVHRDPDLIPGAVEEIIRYATPVLHMRRTATRPTVLNDVAIDEGDKVVIWYASANFDDQIFTEPQTFDVARPIKPKMVSFGAQGPHHCLGAPLARLEIRILLEEIVRRGIRFESTGPIIRTPSNFVNGITSLPARLVTRS